MDQDTPEKRRYVATLPLGESPLTGVVQGEYAVSVDKVRKFIIREGYADLPVHVANPSTLPKDVLV